MTPLKSDLQKEGSSAPWGIKVRPGSGYDPDATG